MAFWLLWTAALTAFWLLAIGVFNRTDAAAALIAGAAAASTMVTVRRRGLLAFRFRSRWLLEARLAPWYVLREFDVVLVALVRRPRSRWRELPFRTGRADAVSTARRGFFTWAGTVSPNTIVVDMDSESDVAVVHELDPRRAHDSVV